MQSETGDSIYHATTNGRFGDGLRAVCDAVAIGRIKRGLIFDTSDLGRANGRNFKLLISLVQQLCRGGKCLIRHCRCDGHMWHISAAIVLTRSAIASPSYSSAIMLRCGSNKWRMRAALESIVAEEIEFHQGGDPNPQHREYAETVLQNTVLRNFIDNTPVEGSESAKVKGVLEKQCTKTLDCLNLNWVRQKSGASVQTRPFWALVLLEQVALRPQSRERHIPELS